MYSVVIRTTAFGRDICRLTLFHYIVRAARDVRICFYDGVSRILPRLPVYRHHEAGCRF